MLDAQDLRRRLIDAMDKATPRVTSAALAEACGVTPQAVNGWRKTGRIAKRHLPKVAELTEKPLEYFLGETPGGLIAASHGLKLVIEEAEAIKRLRESHADWRRYVLGLAMVDRREQELLLKTMQQAVPDYRVDHDYGTAAHVRKGERQPKQKTRERQ